MEQEIDRCTVVVADWEMKCCGTPFKVGDTIEWFVSKSESEKLLVDMGNIDFDYDHHSFDNKNLFKIKGNVVNIFAIHYAYKKVSENPDFMVPISGISVEIKEADGWDEDIEGKELCCYYVCLENVNLIEKE